MLQKVLNGKSAQKSVFISTQKSAQRTILLKKVLLKWLKKSKFTQKRKFAQKSSSKKFILRKSYAEKWQILKKVHKKGKHSKKYFCKKSMILPSNSPPNGPNGPPHGPDGLPNGQDGPPNGPDGPLNDRAANLTARTAGLTNQPRDNVTIEQCPRCKLGIALNRTRSDQSQIVGFVVWFTKRFVLMCSSQSKEEKN